MHTFIADCCSTRKETFSTCWRILPLYARNKIIELQRLIELRQTKLLVTNLRRLPLRKWWISDFLFYLMYNQVHSQNGSVTEAVKDIKELEVNKKARSMKIHIVRKSSTHQYFLRRRKLGTCCTREKYTVPCIILWQSIKISKYL